MIEENLPTYERGKMLESCSEGVLFHWKILCVRVWKSLERSFYLCSCEMGPSVRPEGRVLEGGKKYHAGEGKTSTRGKPGGTSLGGVGTNSSTGGRLKDQELHPYSEKGEFLGLLYVTLLLLSRGAAQFPV